MEIDDPIALVLNVTPINFVMSDDVIDPNENNFNIPWNKNTVGLQEAWNKGLTTTQQVRKNISIGTKIAMNKIDPSVKAEYYKNRDSCQKRRWMNKNGKHVRIPFHQINEYIKKIK